MVDKLEEFAANGDKNLDGLNVADGFPKAEKPERPWFNMLFNKLTLSINGLIDSINSLSESIEEPKSDTDIKVTPITDWQIDTTQDIVNNQTVSSERFGIIVGSLEDQTDKMDAFLEFLRTSKRKGIIPKGGVIKVTANKQRIFGTIGEVDYKVIDYAMDISGVDLQGVYKGYENAFGTIIDVQNTGCAMLQAQQNLENTTYTIKNIRVENSSLALKMTYALMCKVENFVYKNCIEGLMVGEPTFSAGAMSNVFVNVYGSCSGAPLQLLGKQWNNANQFHSCFFTGGQPSKIHVSGGYGAIANSFYGGEFNSIKDTNSSGIIIGNSRSTNFFGTYFEPRGHALILDGQAKKVLLNGCAYGSTRNDSTLSTQPCLIWHKSQSASLTIVGGSIFLGDNTGLQNNMRLVHSDDPTVFQCNIVDTPYAYLTGTTGWKIADMANVSRYNSFVGSLTESMPIVFSSAGASINNLSSDSNITYNVNGSNVTAVFDLGFTDTTVFNSGEYYLELLFIPKVRAVGNVIYSKSGVGAVNIVGACNISRSNKNLFLRIPTVTSTFDSVASTVSSAISSAYASSNTLAGYNTNGSRVYGQITYPV